MLGSLLLSTAPVRADITESRNWQLMFEREEPRGFERFPEDVDVFIDQGEGWYTQFNSTTVWQQASESKTDLDNLLNTVYKFSGGWAVTKTADIAWWIQGGRPVGDPRDANLSAAIGSVLDVNGSLVSAKVDIQELYWAQKIGQRFRLSAGIIDSTWRYDFNDMANSDSENFISLALVNSPGIPFPDRSLALDFLWQAADSIDIHAGMYQTGCEEDGGSCFDKLSSDDWLLPVEIIFKSALRDWDQGKYRLLFFETKDGEQRGSGVSFNFEQPIGRFVPFARATLADKEITEIYKFISFGAGFSGFLGRRWDMLGVGFARGKPSDPARRTESLVEVYWRVQLNPFVSITPDVQLVVDPADNPEENQIWVLGARLQFDF